MGNSTQQNEANGGTPLAEPTGSPDSRYAEARFLVVRYQSASWSFLQRRMHIGWARAARLITELERNGVVGPFNQTEPRKVLLSEANAHALAEERSDDSQQRVVGGKVDR